MRHSRDCAMAGSTAPPCSFPEGQAQAPGARIYPMCHKT
jgi:hypothetical protein